MSWFGGIARLLRARLGVVAVAGGCVAGSWVAAGAVGAPHIDYERLADEPVASVRFIRLRDWEALDDRTIVLWVGRQEPYLVKLDGTCVGLTFNITIGVTSSNHRLAAGFDRVLTADGNCRIVSIQPLDYAALQTARIEMRAGRDVRVSDRTARPEANGLGGAAAPAITVSTGQNSAVGRGSRERN